MVRSTLTCLVLLGGTLAACGQEIHVLAKQYGSIPGDPGGVFGYVDASSVGRAGFYGDHQVYFHAGREGAYGPGSLYSWSLGQGVQEVLRGQSKPGIDVPHQPVICNSAGDIALYVTQDGSPSQTRILHADGSTETIGIDLVPIQLTDGGDFLYYDEVDEQTCLRYSDGSVVRVDGTVDLYSYYSGAWKTVGLRLYWDSPGPDQRRRHLSSSLVLAGWGGHSIAPGYTATPNLYSVAQDYSKYSQIDTASHLPSNYSWFYKDMLATGEMIFYVIIDTIGSTAKYYKIPVSDTSIHQSLLPEDRYVTVPGVGGVFITKLSAFGDSGAMAGLGFRDGENPGDRAIYVMTAGGLWYEVVHTGDEIPGYGFAGSEFDVHDIMPDGSIIFSLEELGQASRDGLMVWIIPEPATLILLAAGGLALLRKRRG